MTTPQGMLLELADKIEQRATNVQAPPFDDLIEENWKVVVAALRLSAAPSAARVCPKCDGTKEIEYEITYHGDRNERVRDKCNGCGGTGVISASPAGNEGRDIERIMFEIYKYGYQNRHDWPEERMWDDFKATRGSIFWDNAKRAAEAISALSAIAPDGAREITDSMIEAGARELWNDLYARHGGTWESRGAGEVCVIQLKATMRAALKAALALPAVVGIEGREETPTRQQMEAAAKVMCDEGFEISLPWECSLDDVERHRYETLAKAISVAQRLARHPHRAGGG